jgi:hypothetical protein
MHSGICDFVSDSFYNSSLVTHPGCNKIRGARVMADFVSETYGCKPCSSFVFSVSDSTPLVTTAGTSFVSPQYITFIMSFVVKLHQFMRKLTKDEQMPDDSILVLP